MVQPVADVFPEQLTRDLDFILNLDVSQPTPVRRPLGIATLGSVTASASICFSTLAVLVTGAALTLTDRWPTGSEREAASPTPRRDAATAPAQTVVASAVVNLEANGDRTTVGHTATGDLPDQATALVRPRDRAGAPIAKRAHLAARIRMAANARPRPQTPNKGNLTAKPPLSYLQLLQMPPIARTTAEAVLSTPSEPASAAHAPMTVNSAPTPVAKLRNARRDAQDALIGLRRQL